MSSQSAARASELPAQTTISAATIAARFRKIGMARSAPLFAVVSCPGELALAVR
jgi:hypothetical protein